MRLLLFVTSFFVLVVSFFVYYFFYSSPKVGGDYTVQIRDAVFAVEVARDALAWERGLSYRDHLPEGRGMLFEFPKSDRYGFWMKDMRFPIDIIWIDAGVVVGFVERAAPDDRVDRTVYYPPKPVASVLEVPAGTVARFGISAGDPLRL